jgi:hypothetical protein
MSSGICIGLVGTGGLIEQGKYCFVKGTRNSTFL